MAGCVWAQRGEGETQLRRVGIREESLAGDTGPDACLLEKKLSGRKPIQGGSLEGARQGPGGEGQERRLSPYPLGCRPDAVGLKNSGGHVRHVQSVCCAVPGALEMLFTADRCRPPELGPLLSGPGADSTPVDASSRFQTENQSYMQAVLRYLGQPCP